MDQKTINIRIRTSPTVFEQHGFVDPKQGFDTEVVGVDAEGNEYAIAGIVRLELFAEGGRVVNQAVLYCATADIDVAAEALIKSVPRPKPIADAATEALANLAGPGLVVEE